MEHFRNGAFYRIVMNFHILKCYFLRLSSPDFNLFENYKTYMKQWPNADFHLVDPRSIWNLWKALKRYSKTNVRWNPPSSGFIGWYYYYYLADL